MLISWNSGISTSPSSPAIGQQFNFTINGSSFDAATAEVLFNGPGGASVIECCYAASCTRLSSTMIKIV